MIGQVFGRLTIVSEAEPYRDKNGRNKGRQYVCLCECGTIKINTACKLKQGERKSCGCSQNLPDPEVTERKRLKRLEIEARKAFISANKKTKEQINSESKARYYIKKAEMSLIPKLVAVEGVKCCIKCNIEKPVKEFHKDMFRADGRRSECKKCKVLMKKELRNNNELVRRKDNEYSKKWINKNKKRVRLSQREYNKRRLNVDPIYRWRRSVRRRLTEFTTKRRWEKVGSYSASVGCSGPELRAHLEAKFVDGMSWDNRNEWHIDHIIPLSSANTLEDMLKLNHYSNLQPLWAKDNLAKSNKIAA